mmetsp:Transcript_118427/g.334813  ORF Transcript_118427/g.334813 Transcript_118427/m.334813 type:complete len:254 (+) Transcript_118427:444-1205(+)
MPIAAPGYPPPIIAMGPRCPTYIPRCPIGAMAPYGRTPIIAACGGLPGIIWAGSIPPGICCITGMAAPPAACKAAAAGPTPPGRGSVGRGGFAVCGTDGSSAGVTRACISCASCCVRMDRSTQSCSRRSTRWLSSPLGDAARASWNAGRISHTRYGLKALMSGLAASFRAASVCKTSCTRYKTWSLCAEFGRATVRFIRCPAICVAMAEFDSTQTRPLRIASREAICSNEATRSFIRVSMSAAMGCTGGSGHL